MIDFNSMKIHADYDSPININCLVDQMTTDIANSIEDGVMKAVIRAGFDIDKDKLVQILQQDKERYQKAYRSGYNHGYQNRDDEIVRCKDCKHHGNINPDYCINIDQETSDDFFCAYGRRRDA